MEKTNLKTTVVDGRRGRRPKTTESIPSSPGKPIPEGTTGKGGRENKDLYVRGKIGERRRNQRPQIKCDSCEGGQKHERVTSTIRNLLGGFAAN